MVDFRLRGRVLAGMFPNEKVVLVSDVNGQFFSVLVPEYAVTAVGEDGLIDVRVLAEGDDVFLVQLPGEVFGAGRVITVRDSQLERASV